MEWKSFWELTTGIGYGIFAMIYVLVLIKGIPEAMAILKKAAPNKKHGL